jgi:hypothetical protein
MDLPGRPFYKQQLGAPFRDTTKGSGETMRNVVIFTMLACTACGPLVVSDIDYIGDAGENDYPMDSNDPNSPVHKFLWTPPSSFLSIPPMELELENKINEKILVLVDENANECQVIALYNALHYYATKWGYSNLEEVFDVFFTKNMGEDWLQVSMRTIRVIFKSDLVIKGRPLAALGGSYNIDKDNVDTWIGAVVMLDICFGGAHPEIYIHEFGHVFGLTHHKNSDNIMYATVTDDSIMEQEQLEITYEFARLHSEKQ